MLFKQQRIFGLVMCALLTALALWLYIEQQWLSGPVFMLACTLMLVTIIAPRLLRYPCHLWQRLGLLLEIANSYLTLGLLFFLILTPIGLFARLLGHDPLVLKRPKKRTTYWQQRDQSWAPDSFKDQF